MVAFDCIRCIIFRISCGYSKKTVSSDQFLSQDFKMLGYFRICLQIHSHIFTKLFLCIFSIIKIDRTVDLLEVCTHCFSVLVGYKFAAVSYLMNDTELIFCPWKYRIYCVTKSCQIICDIIFRMEDGNENVRNTAVLEVLLLVACNRRIYYAFYL